MGCGCNNVLSGAGGLSFGGSATIETNQLWDEYVQVFHLQESGNGTAGEFTDSAQGLDAQGNGGNPVYTPTRVSNGVFCGAYCQEFDGNDYITCLDDNHNVLSALSVSCWVKVTNKFTDRCYYSRGRTTNSEDYQLAFGHNGSRQLTATVQTVDSNGNFVKTTVTGDEELDLDTFYHVACVVEPGDSISLYLNGVLEATKALTNEELITITEGSFIGRLNNVRYMKGMIQEVRVKAKAESGDWFMAEHANFCDSSFYEVGLEENPVYG